METFEIKNTLIAIRESRGYSKRTVSEMTGIPYTTYIKYESGERKDVSMQALCKLADFYGVTTDYLLGREKQSTQPNPLTKLNLPADTEAVVETFTQLPELMQKAMIDILLQLSDAVKDRRDSEKKSPIIMTIKKHINKAAAGAGYDLDNEDHWEHVKVIQTDEAERADFAVEVDGDSMLPEYHDGDLALIVLADDVEVGQVGLFMQNGKGFIKQKGEDRLISINPDYPDIYPEDGEIVCRGRVIGVAELPE